MQPATLTVVPDPTPTGSPTVVLPRPLLDRLVRTTTAAHVAGLKSFGLLLADPLAAGYPFTATDVAFFDPTKNRRNDPAFRPAFEAQGQYFRSYDDAGFVADPAELLQVHRRLEALGVEAVAPFHVHRRQPANFSLIDFRLHNPAYLWHLIVSLRDPRRPVLRPFAVDKPATAETAISPQDRYEGSERPYPGPEVRPLRLDVRSPDELVRRGGSGRHR